MQGEVVAQSKLQRAVAQQMQRSKQQVPHFYVQTEIVMDPVLAELERRNEAGPPATITLTAALVAACVEALGAHPAVNGIWTDDGPLAADEINVGVAVALDEGLLAPALLHADRLGLSELAAALRDLADRARAGRLTVSEMSEATFTLSNLGMFEVNAFTAIISPPQLAILATGTLVEGWRLEDGAPAAHSVLTATLSADHRALDGVAAARFLQTFKHTLETANLP
jgi:pyruvate dehydrogenase E2 component (dihydrolipoamide acetyltransferase)